MLSRGRQDRPREDSGLPAALLDVHEPIFGAKLDIPATGAPAGAWRTSKGKRQRRRELQPLGRAIVEIEPALPIHMAAAAVERDEVVDFPMPEIGRLRVVGLVWRTGNSG